MAILEWIQFPECCRCNAKARCYINSHGIDLGPFCGNCGNEELRRITKLEVKQDFVHCRDCGLTFVSIKDLLYHESNDTCLKGDHHARNILG